MIGYTLNLRLLTYLRLSAYCSAKNFTQNIHIFLQSTSQCIFIFFGSQSMPILSIFVNMMQASVSLQVVRTESAELARLAWG